MTGILITRPIEDALRLKKQMQDYKGKIFVDSLIKIIPLEYNISGNFDAVIISSANAVRDKIFDSAILSLPCYCIGEQSAEAAKNSGFKTVYFPDNQEYDASGLVKLIQNHATEAPLYICGKQRNGWIEEELNIANICETYDAVASEKLKDETIVAFKNNKISDILFYSKRSVAIFIELAKKHKINCTNLNALCLNQAICDSISRSIFKDIDRLILS